MHLPASTGGECTTKIQKLVDLFIVLLPHKIFIRELQNPELPLHGSAAYCWTWYIALISDVRYKRERGYCFGCDVKARITYSTFQLA